MYQFTERAQAVLHAAQRIAKDAQHGELTPAHVLYAIIDGNEEFAQRALTQAGVGIKAVHAELKAALDKLPRVTGGSAEPSPGSNFSAFLTDADNFRKDLRDEYVSVEHFLLAATKNPQPTLGQALKKLRLDEAALRKAVLAVRGNNRVIDQNPEAKLGVLEKFARDLTQLAADNKLDPVIGRDAEVRRVIQILSRRSKNNPVLIGEPGVGKTAIAEGLAQRIIRGDVPDTLKNRKLMALDISSLVAGAKYRGEFEERLKGVLKAVQDAAGGIILFIDEIHTIVKAGGAEGAMDAGNMLKPALARGELRCIGATTLDEYRIIEKDPALERRFQPVIVAPPSVEDTITILRGLKERYELHHGVRIKDAALVAAARLSDRYIADRFLPDKAIDLIDESASRLKIQLESVPEAIDAAERKIVHLKMEQAGLKRESDSASLQHAKAIESQIADLEGQVRTMRAQWQSGKGEVDEMNRLKRELEQARLRLDQLEKHADYAKASEIKFGEIPKLEKALEEVSAKLAGARGGSAQAAVVVKEEVDQEDVANVVSAWTGIPVNKIFAAERERLLGIEDELRTSVVGQDRALTAVANAIRLSRSGLREAGKPMGSFLFLGPTGVGKTETAKTLARYLFDTEKSMVRIDMSEYMEEHAVAKLIGSPPGYVGFEDGGQLTEAVRRTPYSVLLFDEIEKAHPRVLNLLLQMLDDGRLTDSHGRTVSFQNTVIIMTSNIGALEIIQATAEGKSPAEVKKVISDELLRFLRPEFLNRIDEVIVFEPLAEDTVRRVVEIQLARLDKRLQAQGLHLKADSSAIDFLAKAGWDPQFGARPVRRAIQEQLEIPLSRELLGGKFAEGDTLRVSKRGDALEFTKAV